MRVDLYRVNLEIQKVKLFACLPFRFLDNPQETAKHSTFVDEQLKWARMGLGICVPARAECPLKAF